MNINEKNYEEFLVRHIENDLSEKEKESLFLFLDEHAEFRHELELFEQTRLVPDETISFGDKSLLKRTGKRFYLNNWLVWSSVAAAILILIYFKFLSPQMTGVNSLAVKQNSNSTKNMKAVAVNNAKASSPANANLLSNEALKPKNANSDVATSKKVIQPANVKTSLATNQIENTIPAQQINSPSQSQQNFTRTVPAENNSTQQNSVSANQESMPVVAVNSENENSGSQQLSTVNEIIPAVYVSRKREILVSKVPDVYYGPVASVGNQQTQQGNPFKDIASLFKAAVDHTPITQTSFYQHSSVGRLLTTQVVYEHH